MQRSASELKKNLPILSKIDDEIKKILMEIYSKINDAFRINEIEIITQLPTQFNHLRCNFMSNEDLKKRIYYKIITSLEENGYKVGLKTESDDLVLLKVSWQINISDDDIKRMDQKLESIKF